MSKIPDHLLKRSKAAKAAKTGEPVEDESSTRSTAVEKTAAAAPAVATGPAVEYPNLDPEPEPAPLEKSFITAAKARKKIPAWVLPVVAALPIWAFSFAGTMQVVETEDIVAIEGEIFYADKGCAGCHGGGGGGGTGYALSDGEVLETFPEPIDMMAHIARGSAEIAGQEYGAEHSDGTRRVAGARGVMPRQIGQISMLELELITYHERVALSDEDADGEEFEAWFESMEEQWESGGSDAPLLTDEDLGLLLACANPDITPGATGEGPPDDEVCPGPPPSGDAEDEEEADA